MYSFGLCRYLVDVCLVGCMRLSVCVYPIRECSTLEYALDFGHLCRIVEFPELFCLLRQFLSLHQRVALVSYEIRGGIVEGGYERGKIDVYSTLSALSAEDATMPSVLLHAEMALWNLFSSAFSNLLPSALPASIVSTSLTCSGAGSAMSAISMVGELRPRVRGYRRRG